MSADAQTLQTAFDSAVGFLAAAQQADGHWSDFRLPVGVSDEWITGLVGTLLALSRHPQGRQPSQRAAGWLARSARQPGRWGYNRACEPDADSTAWAGMLHDLTGDGMAPDLPWLLRHRTADGGFATYIASDAWGRAHPCVTAVVLLALPEAVRFSVRDAGVSYLKAQRLPGGAWPAYWWASSFYSTLWAVRCLTALNALGQADRDGLRAAEALATARSGFDLACAVALAASGPGPSMTAQTLALKLAQLQQPHGRWAPSRCLRVTPHWIERPAPDDGEVYADDNGLLTAAAAVFAFGEVLRQCA